MSVAHGGLDERTQPALFLAQACDRSQKFALCRRLAPLREYLLVDPETHRGESLRRTGDGRWTFHDMSPQVGAEDEARSGHGVGPGPSRSGGLEVARLGCTIALADVFDGVDPPAESA